LDKGFGQGFKQPEGSSSLDPRSKTPFKWGQVRATPYGSCIDTLQTDRDASEWHESRNENLNQPEHLMTLLDGIFHANVKRPDDLIRLEHILYPQDPDTA
jgi:hypothetical protein